MTKNNNTFLATTFTDVMSYDEDTQHRATFAFAEFMKQSGISEERAKELVDLGWLKPTETTSKNMLFRQIDVYRARKADRLCLDFELPSLAGAIIVDLLEKIDALESELKDKK